MAKRKSGPPCLPDGGRPEKATPNNYSTTGSTVVLRYTNVDCLCSNATYGYVRQKVFLR